MMTWCFFSTQMAQLVARAVPIFRCEVFASILVLTFPPSGLGSRPTLIGAQGPLTPTCQQTNGWNNFRQCRSSYHTYVPEGVQFPLTMGQSASPSQYRRCLCLWPSMEHHVHCAHWNSWLLTSRTSESNDWLIIQGLHFWLRTGRSKIVGQRQQSNDTTNEDRTNSENHDSPKAWIPKGGFGMSILIHWSTLILMLLTLLIQNIICVLELDLANVADGFRWQSLSPEIRGLIGGLFHVESLKHEWDNQDFWNSKNIKLYLFHSNIHIIWQTISLQIDISSMQMLVFNQGRKMVWDQHWCSLRELGNAFKFGPIAVPSRSWRIITIVTGDWHVLVDVVDLKMKGFWSLPSLVSELLSYRENLILVIGLNQTSQMKQPVLHHRNSSLFDRFWQLPVEAPLVLLNVIDFHAAQDLWNGI